MTIYKIMLTMWVVFWALLDLLFIFIISKPLLNESSVSERSSQDIFITIISTILGFVLVGLVYSVEKNYKNKKLGWQIIVVGFLYFFGKNIFNLALNFDFLKKATEYVWITPIVQFAWLFPSLMFLVANTYFAAKYCIKQGEIVSQNT